MFQQQKTERIRQYSDKIRQANSESAKKELFLVLLNDLFANDESTKSLINDMAMGAEKTVAKIPLPNRLKKGRADTQYANVIIEFEKNLQKTEKHAKEQLAEYLAGNWNSGQDYNFTLISTDCLVWKIYAPSYEELTKLEGDIALSDFELRETDSFTLTENNTNDFYFFLDRYLFKKEPQHATLELIQQDFGGSSKVFLNCMYQLREYYDEIKDEEEIKIAYDQWYRFLSIAYSEFDGSERVFLVHTYLSIFAKMLAYSILTNDDFIDDGEMKGILDGSIFDRLNIKNFTDNDFFFWVGKDHNRKALKKVFRTIAQQISTYDFTHVDEDILKGVYQELIDLDTRHALGEYYTPDWLCAKVTDAFDFKKDSKILDPSCGSGSFLRAAIDKLKRDYPDITAEELANNVSGIDIHPLSVQIAKTTILLAIGDKMKTVKKPVTLNVFLANTLLTPEGTLELFDEEFIVRIDEKRYSVATSVFDNAAFFDTALDICDDLADLTKNDDSLSISAFEKTFKNKIKEKVSGTMLNSFHNIYKGLKEAKENKRDSIWRFILQNLYKPCFIKSSFDFIIGNPPWFTYSSIKNEEYQNQLRILAERYMVMPEKRKNFPHLEIAAIFLGHCATYFLKKDGQLAFVLPRSFFSADHHDATRRGATRDFKITELWDLDNVSPLFNIPSCVIFGKQAHTGKRVATTGVKGLAVKGRLSTHNAKFEEAENRLTYSKSKWYYSKLGSASAFTDYKFKSSKNTNHYKSLFKQGATIVPRNFYFIELEQDIPPDWKDRILSARTNEEVRKQAKPPWKSLILKNRISSDFIFHTAIAKNIIPYAMHLTELVVLPIQTKKGNITTLNWEEMMKKGLLDTTKWFKQVDELWKENRTDKSKNMSHIDRLNFQKGLTDQALNLPYLVLYTASAKDANATVVERRALNMEFIVESTCYWFATKDKNEAFYLASYLNSATPNHLMKAFQARGLFGARHVHKKILEIPFPKFDKENSDHLQLAKLSQKCHKKAQKYLINNQIGEISSTQLGKLRPNIKAHLEKEMQQIDELIKELII